jgi:hypothetical protein
MALHSVVNASGKLPIRNNRSRLLNFIKDHKRGSGKNLSNVKKNTKRKVSEKMKMRNEMVRKLMKENKMTLPEASKYIKENNLM